MPITITGGKYASATLVTTTLASAISASATSIALVSAAGFSASGTVSIGSEEITYTGISTNTLTGCTRGTNFTTAAAQSSGVAVRRGRRADIFVTTTPFVSTDFTDDKPRRVEVYNSAGTVFRGTAFVRRFVSTSQLELESNLYDPYNRVFVEAQAGDTMLVSKNFVDIAQTNLVVSGRVVTLSDTILWGTAGQANSVCFHDEGYSVTISVTTAFARLWGNAGGGVSLGHVQDWTSGILYNPVQIYCATTSNPRSIFFAQNAAARAYFFGGSLNNPPGSFVLYIGIGVNSGYVIQNTTYFAHQWFWKFLFYGADAGIYFVTATPPAPEQHVFEECTYLQTGSLSGLGLANAKVLGGVFKMPNFTSAPQCIFIHDISSGDFNIGAESGKRALCADIGNGQAFFGGTRPGGSTATYNLNITNFISPDYRAGDRNAGSQNNPEVFSATYVIKYQYWKDPYSNLQIGSGLAMIRNSDWTADSSVTASTSTADLTVYYGTATGHTPFTSRGPWTARVRRYGFDELEYAVTETPYSLSTAGTAYNVTFGGPQLQVARVTLPAQATADAVTGITVTDHGASPVTWNSLAWSITITADTSVNSSLTAALIWAHIKSQIARTAAWGGKTGLLWHVLVDENSTGVGYISQRGRSGGAGATLKGVRVIDQNGNPFVGFAYMTADDGTTYTPPPPPTFQSVTVTNGVAGTRLLIQDVTNPASPVTLYSGVPALFPHTWTDPVAYAANRDIRVRAAYQSGTSAKMFVDEEIGTVTLASPALSYRLNQVDDVVYQANAINGAAVSGITIDDPTLLINVSASTISLQSIYAYEVYWLSTAAGIVDEGRIVTASDTANYIFEGGWKIKNTSSPSVALTITGGYMVDATTGTAISLIDTTGGTIFLAPDHVVPYATGSGVTPGDKTDIAAAVLAAAQATPIHADAKLMNGATIQGNGSAGNLWRGT